MALQPLPNPGTAVFPNYIAKKTETIIMKATGMTGSYKLTLSDGSALFTIDSESISWSHRKHVLDSSGREICQIRQGRSFGRSAKYYAEVSEDSATKLWQMKSKIGLGSMMNTMTFTNAMTQKPVQMEFKKKLFNGGGEVMLDGCIVALVEKKSLKLRPEYHLTIAPNLDMFLIVGVVVSVDDIVRSSGAAAGAGGGA